MSDDLYHELKLSRESLDFALQSAGMGTWDIDLLNDTVQCSREMLDLWEVNPEEFKGQRSLLQAKVHPDDVLRMREAIDSAIQNRTIYEFEYRILPSMGKQRWVKSRGRCTYALNSDEPIRFSGVVFDITEARTKEAAIEAALKEREQFLTIASHELRTPLTSLQLQLEVLESEIKEKYSTVYTSPIIESGFKKQRNQHLRLCRIIDNIFEHSKISDGRFNLKLDNFDLINLIDDVTEHFRELSRSMNSGEISLIAQSKSIIGQWDRFRLEQALVNVLSNAVRFGNRKPILIEVEEDMTEVYIKISDQGPGIRIEDQERVFEKFGRSSIDNEMSGLGLGLYLTKNIILSHGGKILLKSEIGKGSEFTLVLPLISAATSM